MVIYQPIYVNICVHKYPSSVIFKSFSLSLFLFFFSLCLLPLSVIVSKIGSTLPKQEISMCSILRRPAISFFFLFFLYFFSVWSRGNPNFGDFPVNMRRLQENTQDKRSVVCVCGKEKGKHSNR